MSFVTTTYYVIFTILFFVSIDIECCSMTTHEIISIMSQDPNYKYNPCYIEWKATQDAILTQIWTQREEVEKSIAEYNRKVMDNAERGNSEKSYTATKVELESVYLAM